VIRIYPLTSGPLRRPRRALAIFLMLFAAILLSATSSHASAESRAEKNQDTVFIVDVSSSMREIFDDVKKAMVDYIAQAKPGDNVVLVTFGESATLESRRRIDSDEDLEAFEGVLRGLDPTEYFTNIAGAVEKGMEELRLLKDRFPDHARVIVLMSDGKNNPPDDAPPLTFEEILRRYPNLTKAGDTDFFYLSLGEDPDQQVVEFMDEVSGASFDLGGEAVDPSAEGQKLDLAQVFVEPVSIDLGTLTGPEATVAVSLAFFPARGDLSGKVIEVSMSARFKANPSLKTAVEVKPRALNCSNKPWTKNLTFTVDSLEDGTIVGSLELKPPQGQVLFIEPAEIPVTMTIRQPRVDVELQDLLEFGPIDPRLTYEETQRVLLIPNSAAEKMSIEARCNIPAPEGMSIATSVEEGEGLRELVITVSTDEGFKPDHSMTLEGAVNLSAAEHAMSFSQQSLEMRITVLPPGAEGRGIGAFLSGLISRYGKRIVFAVIGILVAVTLGMGGYYLFSLRSRSALEGKLVLVHVKGKRQQSKSKTVTINLHNVGRSVGRDSITLGSAKDATVTLPHKSVAAHHLEIHAKMDKGNKRIYAEPSGKNYIIINLQKITEPTPLSDKDLVEIGAYTFRFENPHPYKQIVVRRLDGRIEKGTPATWDIESDGFGLLPRDALPGSSEEIFISFSDLKAVYFVRDFDGQIGKKLASPETQILGIRMRLIFHDGEKIIGFTSQNYDPRSPRFYFFPADQTGNTISMVVEREHLKNIAILGAADAGAPEPIDPRDQT